MAKLIEIPTITDNRGTLSFLQKDYLPFEFKRLFYLYGSAAIRGKHAHKKCEQFIIPLHASVGVILDDGIKKTDFYLYEKNIGLYIEPMIWVQLDLSLDSVCLVLASDEYDEEDYIRNYNEFLKLKEKK